MITLHNSLNIQTDKYKKFVINLSLKIAMSHSSSSDSESEERSDCEVNTQREIIPYSHDPEVIIIYCNYVYIYAILVHSSKS